MPRVFDCLVFNGELDLLEARFRAYKDIPEVTHVICEAGSAFPQTGLAVEWKGRWNHVGIAADEITSLGYKQTLQKYLAQGINGTPGDVIVHTDIRDIPPERVIRDLAAKRFTSPGVMNFNWRIYKAGD